MPKAWRGYYGDTSLSGPVIELDPGDRAALAVATHNLSLALAEVVPEVMRIEREGGSAW